MTGPTGTRRSTRSKPGKRARTPSPTPPYDARVLEDSPPASKKPKAFRQCISSRPPSPDEHHPVVVHSKLQLDASFQYVDTNGDIQPTFSFDGSLVVLKTTGASPSLFVASIAVLSKESPVFERLLASDQLERYGTHKGHPVLVVEDMPSDLQVFLKALHHHRDFFESSNDWTSYRSVAAVLRTSTRYQVSYLRKRMIDFLSSQYYPSSLDDYNDTRKGRNNLPMRTHFLYLDLAREVNASQILPALLYHCTTSIPIVDLHNAPTNWNISDSDYFFSYPRDKATCVTAREEIMVRTSKMICAIGSVRRFGPQKTNFTGRFSPPRLEASLCCQRPAWAKEALNIPGILHNPLDSDILDRRFKFSLCSDCKETFLRPALEALWSDLPKLFNLRDWSSLLPKADV